VDAWFEQILESHIHRLLLENVGTFDDDDFFDATVNSDEETDHDTR